MSIQTIGIILCFVVFVVLMMKRICPMAVAYPRRYSTIKSG